MEEPTVLFLIYAPPDQSKVLSLYDRLRAQGFAPWMDVKDILPGERRAVSIQKAFREADFILACLSEASVRQRGFAQAQIRDAVSFQNAMLETDIYLIPVRLEECELPEYLTELQGADLFEERGWADLLRAIQVGIDRRKHSAPTEMKVAATDSHVSPSEPLVGGGTWEASEPPDGDQVFLRFSAREAIGRLRFQIETAHFIIRFGFRNPTEGKGIGRDGVKDRSLVDRYGESLERAYNTLTAEPWSRQGPIVGSNGKTLVYVFDTAEFTSYDAQMVPYICLPANSAEFTGHTDLELGAVHEVAHLFNFRERPFYDVSANRWAWFDEAFALFIEMVVSPDNPTHSRFLSTWIESPEMPLDESSTGYHAVMFVRYIANRLGYDFVNKLWIMSDVDENPFDALTRLMPEGRTFASNDPNEVDLFASGYCMDAYFLADPSSGCFMSEAYQRYGERAVAESFSLAPGEALTTNDTLDHLSCKYYRFYPKGGAERLNVSLIGQDSTSIKPLKAEIAHVSSNGVRGEVKQMQVGTGAEGIKQLLCDVSLTHKAIDHLVVVVSNCGVRADQNDKKKYALQFSAS